MALENDLPTVKFTNEFYKASINVVFTFTWIKEKMSVVFQEEDLTSQQFNILRILRGSHPTPLSTLQIRERMLEKMSDTSRIVDRLVAKGLVKKMESKADRRLVDVLITTKGQKMLARLDKRQGELDGVAGNLTKKEAEQLNYLLDKMRG